MIVKSRSGRRDIGKMLQSVAGLPSRIEPLTPALASFRQSHPRLTHFDFSLLADLNRFSGPIASGS